MTYCHVIFYCLTRDQEDSYTAMRVPSITDSRILEMAIVGQPLIATLKAIDFSGHLLIFQEILERSAVYQHIQFHVVKWDLQDQ